MKRNAIRAANFICCIVNLVLVTGCSGGTPATFASDTQIYSETGVLSNYSSISVHVNLTPMSNNQALIRSIVITVDFGLPACGYMGQIILSTYSNGTLVWDKTGVNKIIFAQPVPLAVSKTITVEPNSLIVVEGGNSYIELEYGIMAGELKTFLAENNVCVYSDDPDFLDPSNAWQVPSVESKIEFDRYSYGTLLINIPPLNEPLPIRPTSTDIATPVQNCQAPSISDLSFNPQSHATVGASVEIHAKADWNSCFRAMRLLIDDKVVYELGQPRFTYVWDTSSSNSGDHIIRLEVAAQGDNDWLKPSVQESNYTLIAETPPTSALPLDRKSVESIMEWISYGLANGDVTVFEQLITDDYIYYGHGMTGGRNQITRAEFLNKLTERIASHPVCEGYIFNDGSSGGNISLFAITNGWKPQWQDGLVSSDWIGFTLSKDVTGFKLDQAYFQPAGAMLDNLDKVDITPCSTTH